MAGIDVKAVRRSPAVRAAGTIQVICPVVYKDKGIPEVDPVSRNHRQLLILQRQRMDPPPVLLSLDFFRAGTAGAFRR